MTDPAARLAQILEQENAALAAFDFPRAVALLTEKQEARPRSCGAQPSRSKPRRAATACTTSPSPTAACWSAPSPYRAG